MSALNVTQAEADVLLSALNMLAKVHRSASGVVPSEVADLLDKLTPQAVVAEVAEPAEAAKEVAEETTEDK